MSHEPTLRLLLAAGFLVVLPIGIYHRLKAHTGEPLDRRGEGWLTLLVLRPAGLVTMAAIVTWLARPRALDWALMPLPEWLRWTGAALMPASGLLLFWTLRTLGPNLTDTIVTRRTHTLVTTGPYGWVRHPFYGAVGLLLAACTLGSANAVILAGSATVMTMLWVRTSAEEERLLERFGDSYRRYMRQTGRFLHRFGATGGRLTRSRA